MTVTKDHIVNSLCNELELPKKQGAELLESLLKIIRGSLQNGEDVLISGFGKFCVRYKKERKGRNPATGEDLMLSPRRVVTFKCSPVLRAKVNKNQ